ncbi:MAG: toll/interleukin-1 receptor domain-containing protein [Verrucomicrobiota bacterium]
MKTASSQAKLTVFLSHSHCQEDEEHVEGLIAFFETLGISVYVDWNDKQMPRITSRATAAQIKKRIKDLSIFMVLATKNALASKWVPWEIGIADQIKGEDQVMIIPVADDYGQFHGSEYLQLYQRAEIATDGTYAVFEPNMTTGGILLESQMKKFAGIQ